jgi:hypothetical protein
MAKKTQEADQAASAAGVTPRWMPIQGTPLAVDMRNLSDRQAHRNHDQSLKRLAERGGLSLQEALALMNEKKWTAYRETTAETALLMLRFYGGDSEE